MKNKISTIQQVVDAIGCPQQPAVILQLACEQTQPQPNIRQIKDIVIKDIGASVHLLKMVNAPFFRINENIQSIHHALTILGSKHIKHLVTDTLVSNALATKSTPLTQKIWRDARQMAAICAYLSSQLSVFGQPPLVQADSAYTLGLLHDCGILLLMRKFPIYMELYQHSIESGTALELLEEKELGTTHSKVGYLMCLSWRLTDALAQSVRFHHDMGKFMGQCGDNSELKTLLAILGIAKHILNEKETFLPQAQDLSVILSHLDMSAKDFQSIRNNVLGKLEESHVCPSILQTFSCGEIKK